MLLRDAPREAGRDAAVAVAEAGAPGRRGRPVPEQSRVPRGARVQAGGRRAVVNVVRQSEAEKELGAEGAQRVWHEQRHILVGSIRAPLGGMLFRSNVVVVVSTRRLVDSSGS